MYDFLQLNRPFKVFTYAVSPKSDMSTITENEDLRKERAKCTFNIEELTYLLDDGYENTRRRRDLENKVLSTKGLLDEIPEEYLSHKEKYENVIRKCVKLHRALLEYDDLRDKPIDEKIKAILRDTVSLAVTKDNSPMMLHSGMFLMAIEGQANEKQQEYWLKRGRNMEIIGTYAQTELGHGTFLRGLELRATYDEKTEEFILHSPTLTSYKWWPGGLAHTANYAIVMAQLYIKDKCYGMQPFMVQLRDEETHMPLPGIKVGEIGPKLGFNTVNNGFLGFENVRIPRDRMLMKNAQVLKDGTFIASPNSKLTYNTMVNVRVLIVNTVAKYLSSASTIAVRYAAVRRQSQMKPGEPEPQILDYVTQQHKLMIAIATSHAYHFTVRWLYDVSDTVKENITKGQLDTLPELHVLACALKVLSSSECTSLVEVCRRACGGHGYMLSSNLPQLYGVCTATMTYEGENTVLLLQVARSLVKAWDRAARGQPLSPSMSYIENKTLAAKWDASLDGIVRNFQIVSRSKLASSVASFQQYMKSGLSYEDAWNKASVQLIAAAEAHGRAIVLAIYKQQIEKQARNVSLPLRDVLHQLLELYMVYWTLEKVGDLLLYTQISERDVKALQRRYEDLLEILRPNAVGLVDAFDIRDEVLCSTLGSYDGRVYERLMEEAMKSPLNKEPVNDTFHKYLKPFMRGKL
nr:probable peroxisomal acyl-coenzyme A oxidase 1 [Danaus plexippus plexippus]